MAGSDTGRVVVGIARSIAGYQALRYAVAHARERGATLVVVRAVNAHSPGDAAWSATVAESARADVLAIFAETFGGMPRDLAIALKASEGVTGRVLVAAADRDADVLIIGGSGRHLLARPWSGAVARYCARHAGCPVVIVPPPAMARAGRTGRLARSAADGAEEFLRAPTRGGTRWGTGIQR